MSVAANATGRKEMYATKEATPEPQTAKSAQGTPRGSPGAREFRFVNNSQSSMVNPVRTRMKPAFKAQGVLSNHHTSLRNQESLIIEQTFDPQSAHFVNSPTDISAKYVFQMNVKRPPGRPRKHPVAAPKPKRPQGRPRKYPIEVSGSSITKLTKKAVPSIMATPASPAPSKGTTSAASAATNTGKVYPVDAELLRNAVAENTEDVADKPRRGRPRKEQPLPKEDHDVATSVAAAAVAAHLLNDADEK